MRIAARGSGKVLLRCQKIVQNYEPKVGIAWEGITCNRGVDTAIRDGNGRRAYCNSFVPAAVTVTS